MHNWRSFLALLVAARDPDPLGTTGIGTVDAPDPDGGQTIAMATVALDGPTLEPTIYIINGLPMPGGSNKKA